MSNVSLLLQFLFVLIQILPDDQFLKGNKVDRKSNCQRLNQTLVGSVFTVDIKSVPFSDVKQHNGNLKNKLHDIASV